MSQMPMVLGYQQVRLDTSTSDLEAGLRSLQAFCAAEGYALGEVFVEKDVNKPCCAMTALIAVARATEPAAIVVPSANDLGIMPRVRGATRQRITREAGVPVLIAS